MDIRPLIEASPTDYAEARFHRREKNQVILRKGELEDITSEVYSGVGIRVLQDGAWGFSSLNNTTPDSVRDSLKTAAKMARTASCKKREKVRLHPVAPVTGEFAAPVKDPLPNHPLEEKVDLCVRTDRQLLSHEGVKSSFVFYQELIDEKWIITSDGADVRIRDSKPQFIVGAVAGGGGDLVLYTDAIGITGGWEIFTRRPPELMAEKAITTALALLTASYPPGGKATVVLDPGMVGLLSHEAVGHTMEADFALSGAITREKVGEQVASAYVTMVDSGKVPAGGWTPVDDEGVECKDVVLIEKGVLKGFLHNRETACIMSAEPTGNARAWEYDLEPIIRMRNTYIEKGDWKEEEIIEETKKGYLLKGAGGGQADSNGEFIFEVKEPYIIEGGEVGGLLRATSMGGNAFDVLKTVDAVGERVDFDLGSGSCGKSQPAKVDGGGPYLRCEVLVGGR